MSKAKKLFSLFSSVWSSKRLIAQLAMTDLKKRYAGSYGGIIWAYVVPLVNMLVMWFVFQYGFKSSSSFGGVTDIPFIVWLAPGYIIWTFISDCLMQSANAIPEYSYLVKKVAFKTEIIVPIKIFSSLVIHAFFLVFVLVVCLIFGSKGFWPTWAWFQLFYYLLGAMVLMLGLGWIVSALAVFLKDTAQIVTIFLQIGFWATPVFWDLETVIHPDYESIAPVSTARYVVYYILKCNPFYYLVNGYRQTAVLNKPFWANADAFWQAPYFWGIAILFLFLGAAVFGKTKKHFADVL